MNLRPVLVIAALLAGCGSTPAVAPAVEALRDFIAVSGFETADYVRVTRRFNYSYLNDYFVSAKDGSRHYLIEFRSRCFNLRRQIVSPSMYDQRRDAGYLRESWDTIRGCRIDKIYPVPQAAFEEAVALQQG